MNIGQKIAAELKEFRDKLRRGELIHATRVERRDEKSVRRKVTL